MDRSVEEFTAEAIGVTLESSPDIGAVAIAYRSEQHAHTIRAAMARQQLTNYELVPEVAAALDFAYATHSVGDQSSLLVYDLGSSGLSVSVIDARTRRVHYSERSSDISGDYLDSLIREQQIASGRIAHPPDIAGLGALDALCREAKEQLTTNTAVALPSKQGLVLLAQENFESLITLAIESSARMAHNAVLRTNCPVDGVLAIGGCARIPLIAAVLERSMGVPVIVPDCPETVTARGAALLARPTHPRPPIPRTALDDERLSPAWLSAPATRGKREINGAVLTVSALVVVAAIGLGLGYGPEVLERDSHTQEAPPTGPQTSAPRTTDLDPQIAAVPSATEPLVQESLLVPPPNRSQTPSEAPPPPPPGPNTIVVPGLPPIVLPTIPPELFPFPPPPPP
ncbi:Hsp70 family protein [Nocardia sp. CNY236]|uniref:Hsp70 family protein n=1 Tax=Nocardia sp. CNY236 TaxID=1169152 RepID=UPI001E5B7F3A|nr:Hsp70 family protein [Nocardia sp. CNY236]